MNPLISVIVPTKNSANTLGGCLNSIQNQLYTPIEIIVIDNYSSDETAALAKNAGITVVAAGNERSAQRNTGAAIAQGEYLLFLDSDMEISPHVIQECVSLMIKTPNLQALTLPIESFGEGFWAQCKVFERPFYHTAPWMQAVRFFRKSTYEAIKGFDDSMVAGEDFDIHNRTITKFGTTSIGIISAITLHNEGKLLLWPLMKKKFYYGSHVGKYYHKPYNKQLYKKQSSIMQRFLLFSSNPKKILRHPILFSGTLFMKITEFIAGGLGYILHKKA